MLKPLTYNICSVVRNNDIYIVLFMSKCKAKIFSLDFIPLLGNLPIEKIQEIKILHFMKTLGPLIFSITLAK